MTWKELGTGLQAVRDGRDLPYRVCEGLIGLGYVTGGTAPENQPALTALGQSWLTRWEGVETGSGLLRREDATRDALHDSRD